ncbi:MAG: RNA-binding protein [Pseudomonadota bacterium]
MGRGGVKKEREGPERRCIATGVSGPTAPLIRFVLDPEGALTPDLAEKLPGRGVWLSAQAAAIDLAVKKKLFSRAFRTQVLAPEDLRAHLSRLLEKRAIEAVSLCRKAGAAVAGFEKVRDALRRAAFSGADGEERAQGVFLLQAYDGAEDGRRKLSRLLAPDAIVTTLSADELGLAFARPYVIHALLMETGVARRALREVKRLEGVRGALTASGLREGDDDQADGGAA